MQPPLRTNRQFIAIYSAAITANAPSRVFNTVLHETRNTGLEGGKGEGRGQKLARNGSRQTATAACRPAVSSLICLQSAKRAVSYLFPLNSLHRFIYTNIYIYIFVALCFYSFLSSLFVVNYFPARLLLLHVESKQREFSLPVLTLSFPIFSRHSR